MAKDHGITSTEAAEKIANQLSLEDHPVWGHRSLKIIRSLTESHWYQQV